MIEAVVDMVRQVASSLAMAQMPPTIEVKFNRASPGAGARAGLITLEKSGDDVAYSFKMDPILDKTFPKLSPLVISHELTDLDSFVAYVKTSERAGACFLEGLAFDNRTLVFIDEERPQDGRVTLSLERHPAWRRWRILGSGEHRDHTHHDLADVLLDNREDLVDPAMAPVIAQFRSARTVAYDADLGDRGHEGVKVTWKGAGGQPGAETDLAIPRDFEAEIPAFVGAWHPGTEPKHKAVFRLRVIPPRDEGPPLFRVTWVNALDYELEAARVLKEAITKKLEGVSDLYAGAAKSTAYVIPLPEPVPCDQ